MAERISEAETAMILNTYMYTDYEDAEDGMTLSEIVEDMPEHIDVEETYRPQYEILKEAVKDPAIGNLTISHDPHDMGFNEGTNAATFTSPESGTIYVVYRGTSDGEWMDNGAGLYENETTQQRQAVSYFDAVLGSVALTGAERIVVTGHSKGANKAQYVTMESAYASYIDACYSIDGQGHSKEAVNKWHDVMSTDEYERQTGKMYGINGENDYVSVLGTCIIPASHIFYVRTEADPFDFAAYHDITRMFATVEEKPGGGSRFSSPGNGSSNSGPGGSRIIYHGRKNPFVFKRGNVADYISGVSDRIMNLSKDDLKGVALSAMQIPEIAFGGRKTGLDGRVAGLKDIEAFGFSGIPVIASVLSNTREGQNFKDKAYAGEKMTAVFSGNDSIRIYYRLLQNESERLCEIAAKLKEISEGLLQSAYRLSFYFDSVLIKEAHIKLYVGALDTQQEMLKRRVKLLDRIVAICTEFDSAVM